MEKEPRPSPPPGPPAALPPRPPAPAYLPIGEYVTALVGGRYHPGERRAEERVRLLREPENPHDRFALRVFNLVGESIGYVARHAARELSPGLDLGVLHVQAFLPRRRGAVTDPRDLYLLLERRRGVILFRPIGNGGGWLFPLSPERQERGRYSTLEEPALTPRS